MTSCLKVKENICAYIDNELCAEERLSLEEHISNCPSCKSELDDLAAIVEICTNLPQQELPADFSAKLHEKLLAAAVRQVRDTKGIRRTKGFLLTRTLASIAAGALLIFLAGNFIRFGLLSPKMKAENTQISADMAAEAQAEPAAGAEDGNSGISVSRIESETAADQNAVNFSMAANDAESLEIDRSATTQDREGAAYITGMPDAEDVSSKLSTIAITADETEGTAEKVRMLAADNNGEETDIYSFSSDVMKSSPQETPMAVQPKGADRNYGGGQSQTELRFVFPKTHFDQFTTVLIDTFGAANVQMGAIVTEDMTETVNSMIKESENIDIRLQELQDEDAVKNSDEISRLKEKKEAVDSSVEAIRIGSDLVCVTVYINRK